MDVLAGKVTSIDQIDLATPFLFLLRDETYVGLKVFRKSGDDREPFVAVIWPRHPNGHEPGLFSQQVMEGKTLYSLEGAVILPSNRFEDLMLDRSGVVTGSIVLISGRNPIMPLRKSESETWFADLTTGELAVNLTGRQYARIQRWRLVQTRLREPETLCEFPSPPKAPQN